MRNAAQPPGTRDACPTKVTRRVWTDLWGSPSAAGLVTAQCKARSRMGGVVVQSWEVVGSGSETEWSSGGSRYERSE